MNDKVVYEASSAKVIYHFHFYEAYWWEVLNNTGTRIRICWTKAEAVQVADSTDSRLTTIG